MVSLITALTIQENEVSINPYQNRASEKWGYELAYTVRGNYRPLITCSPIYDTQQTAEQMGSDLVKEIKAIDLSSKRKGLAEIVGEENSKVIQAITSAAKK